MKKLLIPLSLSFLINVSCKKEYSCEKCIPVTLPAVSTISITDVSQNSAMFHGSLLKIGDSAVNNFGFCWADHVNPTIADNKIGNGATSNKQNFSNFVTGLIPDQTYYVKAYAVNSIGTIYGQELNFKTSSSCQDTSLYFDGIHINNTGNFNNDHVDIGTNGPMSVIDGNTSYTIEVWAKHGMASYPGGWERIYSKDYTFQFRVLDNKFTGELGNTTIQTPYPLDTFWHHLAFVRDNSSNTLKLFIDGQLKASVQDNSGSVSNNGNMVCIGARNNGNGIYELWTGNLKYLRVSNIARYTSSFTPAQRYFSDINTLALWPFNDAGGNVLKDVSGNNHNGTIVNAEWVMGKCQ